MLKAWHLHGQRRGVEVVDKGALGGNPPPLSRSTRSAGSPHCKEGRGGCPAPRQHERRVASLRCGCQARHVGSGQESR